MADSESAWLGESAPVSDDAWLKTDAFALPYDAVRFQCMRGTGRVWACDGEYVACRPSGFNPGTAERHASFLASGHYRHVGTFDDVQIFELLPGSPFRRDNRSFIPGVNVWQDMLQCARAAVARDWVLYNDILEEIAKNIKAKYHPDAATQVYGDVLQQIFNSIYLRGGPTQAEVDAGLANVRRARGAGQARVIMIPERTSKRIA